MLPLCDISHSYVFAARYDPGVQCSVSTEDDPHQSGIRILVNRTLKNAYAVSAFRDVPASSAELHAIVVYLLR